MHAALDGRVKPAHGECKQVASTNEKAGLRSPAFFFCRCRLPKLAALGAQIDPLDRFAPLSRVAPLTA
jgi:hypothetical protein